MYHATAFLYDVTAGFEKPDEICDDVLETFRRCGVEPPGWIGDLGCGTGLISILLAEKGWHIYGVDASASMLTVAREKAARLAEPVQANLTWALDDITTFRLPPGLAMDGAICLCNTINHLLEWPQVEGFIHSAFRALKPNGVLVLDSDTFMTFQDYFNHPPVVIWDDGKHRMTRVCQFNEATGRAHHSAMLERLEEAGWRLLNEEPLFLQHHREADLQAAFLAAGFEVESIRPYNPFPKLYKNAWIPKLLWTLRKPE